MAANDHAFHEKPTGMIEEFGHKRKPVSENQAAEIGHKREAAEWNDDEIRQQTDGRDQMKIAGDQRQRTEERGERRAESERCIIEWKIQPLAPCGTKIGRQ